MYMLTAVEGAVQGIPKKHLTAETRAELKDFLIRCEIFFRTNEEENE